MSLKRAFPSALLSTPAPSARCTGPRSSSCRCAPGGSRCAPSRLSGRARPACASSSSRRRAWGSPRAHGRRGFPRGCRAESIVTAAWAMRLSNSSVSIRSEFQISERSVTRDVVDALSRPRGCGSWPSSSTSPVRNTAQFSCIVFCMRRRSSAVGVPPLAWRKRSSRATRHVAGVASAGRRASRRARSSPPRAGRRRGRRRRGRSASWSRAGWRRAPRRRPPRRSPSGPARRVSGLPFGHGQHLAVIVRRDAAHVVVHRRQHRDRLAASGRRRRRSCAVSVMPGRRSCRIFGSRWSRCR